MYFMPQDFFISAIKSNFSDVVINNKVMQFSKDAGFKIVTCRPYRPRTKGKVETLAKIINRLKAYDYEFDNIYMEIFRLIDLFISNTCKT